MRQGLHRAVFKNLNLLSLQSRWGFNCGFCRSNAWRKYTTRGLVSRRGVSLSLFLSLYIYKIDVKVCLFTLKYDVLTQPQGIAVEAREALLRRASQGTLNFHTTKQVCPSFSFFFNSFSSLLCLPYFCSIVCSWRSWMVETVPKEVVLALYVWIGQRIKRDAYQNITL